MTLRKSFQLGARRIIQIDADTALASNSDQKLVTQKAIKAYVDNRPGGGGGTIITAAPLQGTGTVGSPVTVSSAGITSTHLATNSVATSAIQNGAVTGSKIAQGGATLNQGLIWNGTTWAPANIIAGSQATISQSSTNENTLSKTAKKLNQITAGTITRVIGLFIGDSNTAKGNFSESAENVVNQNFDTQPFGLLYPTCDIYSGHTLIESVGNAPGNLTQQANSIVGYYWNFNNSGDSLRLNLSSGVNAVQGKDFNRLRLYVYAQPGGGTIRVRVGHGTTEVYNQVISTDSTSVGLRIIYTPVFTLSSWPTNDAYIRVHHESGTASGLCGIFLENTLKSGLSIVRAGINGYSTQNWSSIIPSGNFKRFVRDIKPDFSCISLGTNDVGATGANNNITYYSGKIKQYLDSLKAYTDTDLWLFSVGDTQNEASPSFTTEMVDTAAYGIASRMGIAFTSLRKMFGDYQNIALNGYYSDLSHYSLTGRQIIGNAMANTLLVDNWYKVISKFTGTLRPAPNTAINIGDATNQNLQGFTAYSTNETLFRLFRAGVNYDARLSNDGTDLNIGTYNYNTTTERKPMKISLDAPSGAMTISSAGNVGVGTGSAPYKLTVSGTSGTVGLGVIGVGASTQGESGIFVGGTTTVAGRYITAFTGALSAPNAVNMILGNYNSTTASSRTSLDMFTSSTNGTITIDLQGAGGGFKRQTLGLDPASTEFRWVHTNGNLTPGTNDFNFRLNPTTSKVRVMNGTVEINVATGAEESAAALQIDHTTKGFLPPRMTNTQVNAITGVGGLTMYNNTVNGMNYHDGVKWVRISSRQSPTLTGCAACGATSGLTTLSGSNDVAGRVSITSGSSGMTAGQLLDFQFATTYTSGTNTFVTLTAGNAAAAALMPYIHVATSPTGFTIVTEQAPAVSTQYLFYYRVSQ